MNLRYMKGYNKTMGAWGEEQAAMFLARKGFKVIDRNYHTTQGEIDIVAVKGGDFYFIEVKTRSNQELGTDLAVTKSKIHKLQKTIKTYCFRKNITEGSFILASLLVLVDRISKKVSFRLAAYC